MKKQSQIKSDHHGFGLIETLLIIIIILILGFVGYYAWTQHKNGNSSSSEPSSAQSTKSNKAKKEEKPTTSTKQKNPNNKGYLVIKEWRIKVKLKDADKVTYSYSVISDSDKLPGSSAESSVGFDIKPEYLINKSCGLGIDMTRHTSKPKDNTPGSRYAVKIDNHYYTNGGSPATCGNKHDDNLANQIRKELSGAKFVLVD